MGRVPDAPITNRLLAKFGPKSSGWSPDRDAALRTNPRPAADGYKVTGRTRQQRQNAAAIQTALTLLLCGGSIVGLFAADRYAEQRYDGRPDTTTPPFCYVEQAPEPSLPTCGSKP